MLLKATLHTVLQHVYQGLSWEVLWPPVDLLLAPSHTQVRTDHTADLVPVLSCEHVHAKNITHYHDLLEESHASLGLFYVHLCTGCDENDPTDVVQQSLLLLR